MSQDREITRQKAGILISFGLGLVILFGLAGSMSLWTSDNFELFGAARYSLLIACVPIAIGLILTQASGLTLDPRGFALALPLLFVIDWLPRSYNLLQGPHLRGELFLAGLLGWLVMRSKNWNWLRWYCAATALILGVTFLVEAQGRLLTSDDHPSFLYRLWLLKSEFPHIPFYYPGWNAGIDQRDFFATGSLNVFLLFAPFIYLLPIEQFYSELIAAVLFLLPALSLYLTARLLHFRPTTALFACCLGLCSSLLWYRWGLKYGTMGFIASSSLVPLNLALLSKLLTAPQAMSTRLYVLLFCTVSVMLLWSPSGLIFIPSAFYALFHIRSLCRERRFIYLVVGLIAVNLPWIVLFMSVSKIGSFVQTAKPSYSTMAEESTPKGKPHLEQAPQTAGELFKTTLKTLRQTSVSANPLLLFLTIPGLFILTRRSRLLWTIHSLWLLLLGAVIAQYRPQLELDRMLVVLAFTSAIPAARSLQSIIALRNSCFASRVSFASTLAFLLVSPLATGSLLRNRSFDTFSFAAPRMEQLQDLIKTHTGEGRVVFSGFVLHDFSHGHLAPLPLLTGKPIVASSPFHDQWTYKELFPKKVVDEGDAAIEALLDSYNATVVVAHEERWVEYFRSRRAKYQVLGEALPFTVFKRLQYMPTYFSKGAGQILEQTNSAVVVQLDTADADLKFAYFPFLRSSLCSLESVESAARKPFIRLRNCPLHTPIRIEACGTWCRVS
jgi:hypothetical protein